MAVWLFENFDRAKAGFQFVEDYTVDSQLQHQYSVGVDGISITMVLLTALLSFLCIFASLGIERASRATSRSSCCSTPA